MITTQRPGANGQNREFSLPPDAALLREICRDKYRASCDSPAPAPSILIPPAPNGSGRPAAGALCGVGRFRIDVRGYGRPRKPIGAPTRALPARRASRPGHRRTVQGSSGGPVTTGTTARSVGRAM